MNILSNNTEKNTIISLIEENKAKVSIDLIKQLINKGDSINKRGSNLMTPLHYSCLYGNFELAKFLIRNRADVDLKDINQFKPIYYAVKSCNKKIVDLIVSSPNILKEDIRYTIVLFYASHFGNKKILVHSVYKGAKINMKDQFKSTILHQLCKNEFMDSFKFLIKINSNIESYNSSGLTLLNYASAIGSNEIAKYLLKNNANKQSKNMKGLTPLNYANLFDNDELIKILSDVSINN